MSIDNIDLATGKSSNAFNTIDAKAKEGIDKFVEITDSSFSGKKYSLVDGKYVESADGNFRRYYRELNNAHIVSLDLSLIVDYYASSTYVYVDDAKTLEAFSPKDRYSLNLYDNRFVQDDNGHYIREGFEFDELLNVILGMDGLKDVLATMLPQIRINTDNEEIGFDVIKNAFSVGELLERLGLNLMLSDKMDDGFKLDVKARLNLQEMGLEDLSKFDLSKLNLKTLLNGIEASIGIDFDYEHPGSNTKINIYLIKDTVYIDMNGVGGPRVQIGLIDVLENSAWNFLLLAPTLKRPRTKRTKV